MRDGFAPELFLGAGVWAAAWFAGDRARLRRERMGELEERARNAERAAERERRLAAAEERMRIARDLHDSAGHAINVILVQAGAARLLQDRDPAGARAALRTVEEVARDTLGEIDQLVRALREDLPAGEVEPPPGLAALDALAERYRVSGLSVTVTIDGARRPLSPAVDQAAFRILQEALTNAAWHGRGSAEVAIDFAPRAARDRGHQPGGAEPNGPRRRRPRHRGHARACAASRGLPRGGRGRRLLPRSRPAALRRGGPVSETPVRVLLVDDDDLMRAGLKAVLSSDETIEVVGEASDGRAALEQVRSSAPAVVLMDVRMPDLDGISATREVLATSPEVKVLILTTFERDDYIFGALNAGASGFLLKRTSPEDLIGGIHTVAVGDSLLSPSVTRRVIDRMAKQPATDRPYDERLAELTPREREVLAQVARGLSNSEIAEELVIEESTVKTHVKRILMKLRLRDRVQAVIFAYESGLTRAGSG